jgi:hypothetical protein
VALNPITIIEAVRVRSADGVIAEYPWDPDTCYLVRDDHPYLDFRTRGRPAMLRSRETKISELTESCEGETQWQRWDLTDVQSRQRRLGEISAELKVPRDCSLRCYVIPTALLSYRDVIVMADDIEAEFGFTAAWDMIADRPGRAWSLIRRGAHAKTPTAFIHTLEEEMLAADAIRRNPFTELGPLSRQDIPLTENAMVSHWAAQRSGQLCDLTAKVAMVLKGMDARSARNNPAGRQGRIDTERTQLSAAQDRLGDLRIRLAGYIRDTELATPLASSPLFQRDHKVRLLLRAFAPPAAEAMSEIESARSHYPPLFLNRLWELWGMVWIARELRRQGFSGTCTVGAGDSVNQCAWHLTRGDVVIELDFEAEAVFIDYQQLPPVHERVMPALEWAARHQDFDAERPFLGTELKCSPDYLVRITTPTAKMLLVGDACLASPEHHGKSGEGTSSKPYTVEKYRRTIGWAAGDQMVRCHHLGGFVLFPAPACAWTAFERVPGASDCILLCPSPQGDPDASRRLETWLTTVIAHDRDAYPSSRS